MLPFVFPWMAQTLAPPDHHRSCRLGHSNVSPSNNKCGPDNAHWELPPQPDDKTRAWIERHDLMDLQVYEAAYKLAQMKKRALGMNE
jgi:hypothetical protein